MSSFEDIETPYTKTRQSDRQPQNILKSSDVKPPGL